MSLKRLLIQRKICHQLTKTSLLPQLVDSSKKVQEVSRLMLEKNKRSIHSHHGSGRTIYALSSGHSRAGIAVVRVSGPECREVVKKVTRKPHLPKPRFARICDIFCPQSGELLDKSMVLWFPGPKSFTGEDVCEFHVHGGLAVIQAILTALGSCKGLYPAEPGEFTKRAFINGKFDLTEAEGLADLIAAETEAQRRQALRQTTGALGDVYQGWREKLLKIVAHVEAFIDFSEDENIESDVLHEALKSLTDLKNALTQHLEDNRCGERLRNGVQVAIVGEPNAGKSSLLNFICQRPAAIVTPLAGTTRDVVESAVNLGGYPVLFGDTAGMREAHDEVEREGVRRATERAKTADIVVIVIDVSNAEHRNSLLDWKEYVMSKILKVTKRVMGSPSTQEVGDTSTSQQWLVLLNKVDLLTKEEEVNMTKALPELLDGSRYCCQPISCKTSKGLEHFLDTLKEKVAEMCGDPLSGNPSLTQQRHRTHLNLCVEAMSKVNLQGDLVVSAEHLREALWQLGKITGHVGVEEVLDVIFKDFCVGK